MTAARVRLADNRSDSLYRSVAVTTTGANTLVPNVAGQVISVQAVTLSVASNVGGNAIGPLYLATNNSANLGPIFLGSQTAAGVSSPAQTIIFDWSRHPFCSLANEAFLVSISGGTNINVGITTEYTQG
jgi:hypothetical protein